MHTYPKIKINTESIEKETYAPFSKNEQVWDEARFLWAADKKNMRQFHNFFKVHLFWEGHKILRNLHLTFARCSASQN